MSDDTDARLQQAAAAMDAGIALIDQLQRGVIEMAAENEQRRARIAEMEAEITRLTLSLVEALGRIEELQGELALLRGTLTREAPETPTQITHDVPPSAPR